MKIEHRLSAIGKANARNPDYINTGLYRLLYCEELHLMAYGMIKGNKGALTKGVDTTTLDGFSKERVDKIISKLRDESFQFKPGRRVYIPKMNGKMRPLGIPTADDKLVQACMQIILNTIYDYPQSPVFSKHSFGFRNGLGCHDALKLLQYELRGSTWIIKADVRGFFDNVNHQVLVEILRKKIKDERFINLVWKLLKSGYVDEDGRLRRTSSGTPQGGVASPILANIYLHEFDKLMEGIMKNNSGERRRNPEYERVRRRAYRTARKMKNLERAGPKYEEYYQKWKADRAYAATLPSKDYTHPDFLKVKYVRYADDWIIGIAGSKEKAEQVYATVKSFFQDTLKLEFNESKSGFYKSFEKDTEFLGAQLRFWPPGKSKYGWVNRGETRFRTRTVGFGFLTLYAPIKQLFNHLVRDGLVHTNGKATHITKVLHLTDYEIVLWFKAKLRGILNYYSFVNNRGRLGSIAYIIKTSCAKTLANKHKKSRRWAFSKYTKNITVTSPVNPKRKVTLIDYDNLRSTPGNYLTKPIPDNWIMDAFINLRSKLSGQFTKCCICNTPEEMEHIEMHHVKHVRQKGARYKGFAKLMGVVNRKQIPVCKSCHLKIHRGQYDGEDLGKLADRIKSNLGITGNRKL